MAGLDSGLALWRTVSSEQTATSRRWVPSINSRSRAADSWAADHTSSVRRRSVRRCSTTAYHAERASTGSNATVTAATSFVRSDRRASIGPPGSDRDGVERLGDRRAKEIRIERLGDDEGRLDLLARQQPLGIAGDEDNRDRHRTHDLIDRRNAAVAAAQLDVGQHQMGRMLAGELDRRLLGGGDADDLMAGVAHDVGD